MKVLALLLKNDPSPDKCQKGSQQFFSTAARAGKPPTMLGSCFYNKHIGGQNWIPYDFFKRQGFRCTLLFFEGNFRNFLFHFLNFMISGSLLWGKFSLIYVQSRLFCLFIALCSDTPYICQSITFCYRGKGQEKSWKHWSWYLIVPQSLYVMLIVEMSCILNQNKVCILSYSCGSLWRWYSPGDFSSQSPVS